VTMGCLVLGLELDPPLPPPPEEQAARIVTAATPAAMGKNRVCLGLIARLLLPLIPIGGNEMRAVPPSVAPARKCGLAGS
jgi:hypothetical protein